MNNSPLILAVDTTTPALIIGIGQAQLYHSEPLPCCSERRSDEESDHRSSSRPKAEGSKSFIPNDKAKLTVQDNCRVLASHFEMVEREHLEVSIPRIKELMKEAKLNYEDLSAIAVGLGPGSLIGSRVGIVIAKTMAQVLEVPLIGISTLDGIAASDEDIGFKAVALNALKDELYWAFYKENKLINKPKIGSVDDFKAEIDKKTKILGTALNRYKDTFTKWPNVSIGKVSIPSARGLIKIGFERLMKRETDSIYNLEPIYLRGPV